MALTRSASMTRGVDPFPTVRTEVEDHPSLANSLQRVLEDHKAAVDRQVLSGQCKSFEEYRNLCGKIEGLDIAIAACATTQRKLTA